MALAIDLGLEVEPARVGVGDVAVIAITCDAKRRITGQLVEAVIDHHRRRLQLAARRALPTDAGRRSPDRFDLAVRRFLFGARSAPWFL